MLNMAVVFDSAGTLLRTYRVAKDIYRDLLLERIVTTDLIMEKIGRALVVPHLDPELFESCDPDAPLRLFLKEESIRVSCASRPVSREEAVRILYGSNVRMADVQDAHRAVRARCPDTYSSAGLIIDTDLNDVTFAISTGGIPFPGLDGVLQRLNDIGADVYVASGDSMRSLEHLSDYGIRSDHIFPVADPSRKREIVLGLKRSYRKVVMVGDGLNDLYALKAADLGVLTVQQSGRPSSDLLMAADEVIKNLTDLPKLLSVSTN
jgi:soluble P-type ATPase